MERRDSRYEALRHRIYTQEARGSLKKRGFWGKEKGPERPEARWKPCSALLLARRPTWPAAKLRCLGCLGCHLCAKRTFSAGEQRAKVDSGTSYSQRKRERVSKSDGTPVATSCDNHHHRIFQQDLFLSSIRSILSSTTNSLILPSFDIYPRQLLSFRP